MTLVSGESAQANKPIHLIFVFRLIFTGWRRSLGHSDLWSLNPRDRSQTVAPKLEKIWQQELSKTRLCNIVDLKCF